jgi:hypothetical protein
MREETMIEAINDIDSIRCMVEDIHEEITNTPDYWTRLEHTYAGMAMQGILSNPELFKATAKNAEEFGLIVPQAVAIDANCFAHALVKKIKEERK